MGGSQDDLQGLRVLVVEDETLVAMLIEEYLAELGCAVAASVRRVDRALEHVSPDAVDVAVLDVNVAGEDVGPVVEALAQHRIPFIFASGYGGTGIKSEWSGYPVVQKPFTTAELKKALVSALNSRQG